MRTFIYSLLTIFAFMMCSCEDEMNRIIKPEASGTPFDLYIVMKDNLRKTALNDTLTSVFEFPMEGTPNGDPYFNVRHISFENFRSSFIRVVANVILIDIDPSNASVPVVTLERNVYANHQTIVKMYGKSVVSLCNYLSEHQAQLRQLFVNAELNKHISLLDQEHQYRQNERLMCLQNVSLYLPVTMNVQCHPASDENFFWVSDNFATRQSHLVVYSVPYTDANIFTLEGAVAVRDSVMGANITGARPDEYMETNQKVILPEYKALNVEGHYVGELRGMWRMKNGMMAGPFVCHLHLDELNQRVIIAEGFCFAPNDVKRRLIRNLEATLYTLRIPSVLEVPEIEVLL